MEVKIIKSDYLMQKLTFDLSKLLPGHAVQLISDTHMPGEEPRKETAIIKDVSLFSITLLTIHLGDYTGKDSLTGIVKENEYPVDAFEGVGCYTLKLMFTEDDILSGKD